MCPAPPRCSVSQTPEGIDLEEKYFSDEDKLKLQKLKAEMDAAAAAQVRADAYALADDELDFASASAE